ncbi:SWIM zinc finger family protein [Antrihabitans sp. NCIMB 15449]|uniref:SWIM zinc finger family protein n=1 Tax=Antrihabitans spumae TaxID=3373370 RepID=A0ABW7JX32_9NOCA
MTSPPQRWTKEQITALVPDPKAVALARRLGPSLSNTGHHANALWGLCQGSGLKPYQTIIDLSGPAFKCSCPSRKFPCKHALSLLISWSEDAVPEADTIADFAEVWIESRAEREGVKAATPAGPKTANPATAELRVKQVTIGLEELDTWIADQVRTGLAQTDRSYTAFEAAAARMVDSKAPGIASTLRRLPYALATRKDWPQRLLGEYAQLHLLVQAHRHLAELSDPLQATVRSHIGYPVAADSVLAERPVRGRWMVLGIKVTEENSLFSRRVWLRERESNSWAVLLDFSHGTPNFPADLPPLGSLIDADLHYYPGAASLRAKLGERHSKPEPFTTLPATGIEEALDDYAAAIGRDPWLRSWPVCLKDVIPTFSGDEWHVIDHTGRAIAISTPLDEPPPWTLLGFSGGYPVTIIGEWTSDGIRVISAFSGGRVVVM